jgi:hypothetical protein
MNKNIFKCLSLTTLLFLTGCGSLQNLSTQDVIQPEYLRRTETFDLTIPQIRQSIFDYSIKCSLLPNLIINPSNSNSAVFQTQMMGLTQANPGIIIVFTQTGKQTLAMSYSYYYGIMWQGEIDDIFEAIKDPSKCR